MRDPLDTPTPYLLSDEVLTAMERDGWTPGQVRDLIKRYRELRGAARPEHGAPEHAFDFVERELRRIGVLNIHIRYWDMGASDTIGMERVGGQWTHGTLMGAFQRAQAGADEREVGRG